MYMLRRWSVPRKTKQINEIFIRFSSCKSPLRINERTLVKLKLLEEQPSAYVRCANLTLQTVVKCFVKNIKKLRVVSVAIAWAKMGSIIKCMRRMFDDEERNLEVPLACPPH